MSFIDVRGSRIEYLRIDVAPPPRPTLVFLHEGLGSAAMWRDFPGRVARAAGCSALVYSRCGYGASAPLREPRGVRYMHDEAQQVLPELLDRLAVVRPILIGHSDGASIALIHAGTAARPVAGVVAMAPHVMVEDISICAIATAKTAYETTELRAKLARFHDNVDSAFGGWNRIWLDPAFRDWNIEAYLAGIRCPLLAIQGVDDEYGTLEQVRRIAAMVVGTEVLALEHCRHSPHRDQPEAVLRAITRFIAGIVAAGPLS